MTVIEYDPEADAIYARLQPVEPGGDHGAHPLDDDRMVHYGHAGKVIGVEFLGVSEGIDLKGIQEEEAIAAALRAFGIVAAAA
jgi:uncharacterized protein YuzE